MKTSIDLPVQLEIPDLGEFSTASERIQDVLDLTATDVERLKHKKPKTLGIVCGRTDCERDLHCFRPEHIHAADPPGTCKDCGVELINWNQMHAREPFNASQKFELLKKEWIRHFFFHVPLTPRIESYARRHGVSGLADVARRQLGKGTMLNFNQAFDARQTSMLKGTIVHWARHATACCCRACMAYWHNVPLTAELSPADLDYFGDLVVLYVNDRMPNLAAEGEKHAES
jgi:hypothetical protein